METTDKKFNWLSYQENDEVLMELSAQLSNINAEYAKEKPSDTFVPVWEKKRDDWRKYYENVRQRKLNFDSKAEIDGEIERLKELCRQSKIAWGITGWEADWFYGDID